MRICVITFPFGTNYGGVLQCYAMKTELEKLGHDVTFLHYWGRGMGRFERFWRTLRSSSSLIGFTKRFWDNIRFKFNTRHSVPNAARKKAFDDFRKQYMKFTPVLRPETVGEYINANFDVVIVGSDQVWTDVASSDKLYFIGWEPAFSGIRISYAACSAHRTIAKRVHSEFRDNLEKFDILTVRDATTASFVRSITGKTPKIVPDPTILHDFSEFRSNIKSEKYILTYVIGSEIPGGHTDALARIRRQLGENVKIIGIICEESHTELISIVDESRFDVSPEEWVNLISGAACVYTDSFHAMIFSMKFSVPFVAYYCDEIRSSRLKDLRDRYSLTAVVNHSKQINTLSRHTLETKQLSDYIPTLS